MSLDKFEKRRLTLYHSLGANFDEEFYLWDFERAFLAAESEYRSDEIKAYLNLISDPYILPDARLKEWRKYFKARQAFMYRDFDQIESHLSSIKFVDEEDMRTLGPRIKLLRSQVQALRGDWVEAQKGFVSLVNSIDKDWLCPDYLKIETLLGLSRAALFSARGQGGWADVPDSRFAILMGWLFRLVLLPLYLPLIIYLWAKDCLVLWKAALWYADDYSNWHMFQTYLTAYHALSKINLNNRIDLIRIFRIRMLRANLHADIGNYKLACQDYDAIDEMMEVQFSDYRKALVIYGRVNLSELQMQDATAKEMETYIQAQETLASSRDEQSAARLGLMLASLDFSNDRYFSGLKRWMKATGTLSQLGEKSVIAEALEILYRVEHVLPEEERLEATSFVEKIQPKVFSARLPNRFFRLIQLLGTAAPLILLLTIIVLLVSFVASSTREDVRMLWQTVFSASGMLIILLVLVGGMVLNTIMGLAGLISVMIAPPTSQEYYNFGEAGLTIFADRHSNTLPWDTIERITVVDRGLFLGRDGSLSYCYLRVSDNHSARLAGTTRQFGRMVKEIETQSGKKSETLRLRWYGGMPFIFAALGSALSFYFTDGIFSAWLSFPIQAQAAAFIMILAYLQLAWALTVWIAHYLNVATRIQSLTRAASIGTGLGLILVAVGVLGRNIFYPAHLMFVILGSSLLLNSLFLIRDSLVHRAARITLSILIVTVLLTCIALTIFTLFPTFFNLEAYAYSGELSKLAMQSNVDPIIRQEYFSKMKKSAYQMLAWDRSYSAAYSYLGNAKFFEQNYQASLEAYSAGIEVGGISDFYYCRALANAKLQKDTQAAADYQTYLKTHEPGRRLPCQILFPEDFA